MAVIFGRAQWAQVPTGRDSGSESTLVAGKGVPGCQFEYTEDCIAQICTLGEKLAFDNKNRVRKS